MKNYRGLTLLELIIVISIISVMTGLILTGMRMTRQRGALKAAVTQVEAAAREAQNYALTGKGAGKDCNEYTFAYGQDRDKVEYSINNGRGCSVDIEYSLKKGVTFKTGDSFTFSAPWGKKSSGNSSIILTDGLINWTLCVCESGKTVNRFGSADCNNLCKL